LEGGGSRKVHSLRSMGKRDVLEEKTDHCGERKLNALQKRKAQLP